MAYRRVEAVPKAQFTHDAMRLFRHCENKNAVWDAVMEYFDSIRPKGASIIDPPETQFKGIDKDAYEALTEGIGRSVVAFWESVDVKYGNRHAKDSDKESTSSRQGVDHITNNQYTNKSSNQINHPTKQEVCHYIDEKGLALDGEDFFKEMERRGWKDKDGNSLRDWRRMAQSWNNPHPKEHSVSLQQYEQRNYTEAQLQARAGEQELLDEALNEQ